MARHLSLVPEPLFDPVERPFLRSEDIDLALLTDLLLDPDWDAYEFRVLEEWIATW